MTFSEQIAQKIDDGEIQPWLYVLEDRFCYMPMEDLRRANTAAVNLGDFLKLVHRSDGHPGDTEMIHLVDAIAEELWIEIEARETLS